MTKHLFLLATLAAGTLSAHAVSTSSPTPGPFTPVVYTFSATTVNGTDYTGHGTIDFTLGIASDPDITFTGPDGFDQVFDKVVLTSEPYLLDGYTQLELETTNKTGPNYTLVLDYANIVGTPESLTLCTANAPCTFDQLELVPDGMTCTKGKHPICIPKYVPEEVPTTLISVLNDDPVDLGDGSFTEGIARDAGTG